MTAGRRRRGRKATRRGRKGVKRGGGAGVAFNQGPPIAVGAASVGRADDGLFYKSDGTPIPNDPPKVGGRRRKSSKKTRKSRRKMRGGASQISMGGTYASFTGAGERGIAHYAQGVKPGNPF